jgi:hypothetical protein
MKQLLSSNYYLFTYSVICLTFVSLFSSCLGGGGFGLGNQQHCSLYKYDEQKKIWVDSSGKEASCTIADNNRIFDYIPEKGCSFWTEFYQEDTVQFVEMPIRIGSGTHSIAQMYCVKQRYISHDNTGQVLLLDEGVFCFTEHPEVKGEYLFKSCEGVQRKRPEDSDQESGE